MKKPPVFIIILILMQLGAAGSYYAQGDWKRGTYWLLAAGLTVVVSL